MKESNGSKMTYGLQKTAAIHAQPHEVFDVFLDFQRWNQWTRSITEMSILNDLAPAPGARIKVLQPKLPPAIWTITEIVPGKVLKWEKRSFGLKLLSEHLIVSGPNATSVTIRITYEGPLAGLFFLLSRSLADAYMTMEIDGLKKECEKWIQ